LNKSEQHGPTFHLRHFHSSSSSINKVIATLVILVVLTGVLVGAYVITSKGNRNSEGLTSTSNTTTNTFTATTTNSTISALSTTFTKTTTSTPSQTVFPIGQNIISNSNFTNGSLASWNSTVECNNSCNKTGVFTGVTYSVNGSNYSAEISDNQTSDWNILYQQFSVGPNEVFKFSADVYAQNVIPNSLLANTTYKADAQLYLTMLGTNTFSYSLGLNGTSAKWTMLECTINTGPNGGTLRTALNLGYASGAAYFDNVTLVRTS
jgi:hypothetical protein